MKKSDKRDGGVLIMVVIALLAVGFLSAGFFKLQEADAVETVHVDLSNQAFWVAESGLQHALHKLRTEKIFRDSPYELTDSVGNGSYAADVWGGVSKKNFTIVSQGTVNGVSRRLRLDVSLSQFGDFSIAVLDGKITSEMGKDSKIVGDVYMNGLFNDKDNDKDKGIVIEGTVFSSDRDRPDSWVEIPEDGYIDMSINKSYFNDLLELAPTGVTITNNTIKLNGGTNVVYAAIDDKDANFRIEGSGILVIQDDQTFEKNLFIGDNVILVVDGDLTIQKDGGLGDNVIIYVTGSADLFKQAKGGTDSTSGSAILVLGDLDIKKNLDFGGMLFSEGKITAHKDLDVTGTIITRDGFELKKDATVTFNKGLIPIDVRESMISSTYTVSQSHWNELPPN